MLPQIPTDSFSGFTRFFKTNDGMVSQSRSWQLPSTLIPLRRQPDLLAVLLHAFNLKGLPPWQPGINQKDEVNFIVIIMSIPVAAPSKVWVWGRLLAVVAGSNPAGDMMSVSCKRCVMSGWERSLRRADHSSTPPRVVWTSVIVEPG